jgi:lipopolysaccharide transport system ATP-binding protein
VEEYWALKDVSFEVRRGEVLGIIGRNGAGKSTLLKLLSRITEPTRGRIEMAGRVASLLEVGTGFHPELTGRENIFLNGAILGMERSAIRRAFDDIVGFAEIERFLDTPVKRYSSGMYVRLAFAVAAHLDPDILIVDEVLAVGDAEFQRKCLVRMNDISGSAGRTVLFVSHNMTAVSSLCTRALVLDRGRVVVAGSVSEAIASYLGAGGDCAAARWIGPLGDGPVEVVSAQAKPSECAGWVTHMALTVEVELIVKQPVFGLIVAWELRNCSEQLLAYSVADDASDPPGATTLPGRYLFSMEIPANALASGDYRVSLDLGIHNRHRLVPERSVTVAFRLENVGGIGRRYPSAWTDLFRPDWHWSSVRNSQS